MSLASRTSSLDKLISKRVLSIEARMVDRYVSDETLLRYLNALDKRVSPGEIDRTVEDVKKYVPRSVLSYLIFRADEYVPDAVANSRKICALLAGVGKYIPDSVIPPESAERWSWVKARFHIPTLVRKGQTESCKEE